VKESEIAESTPPAARNRTRHRNRTRSTRAQPKNKSPKCGQHFGLGMWRAEASGRKPARSSVTRMRLTGSR